VTSLDFPFVYRGEDTGWIEFNFLRPARCFANTYFLVHVEDYSQAHIFGYCNGRGRERWLNAFGGEKGLEELVQGMREADIKANYDLEKWRTAQKAIEEIVIPFQKLLKEVHTLSRESR